MKKPISFSRLAIFLAILFFSGTAAHALSIINSAIISNIAATSATFSINSTTPTGKGAHFEYTEIKPCIAIYPPPEDCLPKSTPVGETTVSVSQLKPATKYSVVFISFPSIQCIKAPCDSPRMSTDPVEFETLPAKTESSNKPLISNITDSKATVSISNPSRFNGQQYFEYKIDAPCMEYMFVGSGTVPKIEKNGCEIFITEHGVSPVTISNLFPQTQYIVTLVTEYFKQCAPPPEGVSPLHYCDPVIQRSEPTYFTTLRSKDQNILTIRPSITNITKSSATLSFSTLDQNSILKEEYNTVYFAYKPARCLIANVQNTSCKEKFTKNGDLVPTILNLSPGTIYAVQIVQDATTMCPYGPCARMNQRSHYGLFVTKGGRYSSVFTRDLGYRMSGNDVRFLQDLLVHKGYMSVSPTGYFGNSTLLAVKKFQKEELGISPTGKISATYLNAYYLGK